MNFEQLNQAAKLADELILSKCESKDEFNILVLKAAKEIVELEQSCIERESVTPELFKEKLGAALAYNAATFTLLFKLAAEKLAAIAEDNKTLRNTIDEYCKDK